MVVIGAMPGSTPTSVPMSAPSRQKPRLAGVSATAKPVARFAKRSMAPRAHHQIAMGSPSALTNSNTPNADRTSATTAFSRMRTS